MSQRFGDEKTVRAVLVDGRAAPLIEGTMKTMSIEVIKTLRHPQLYEAVAYHPDMVICPVGDGKMVVEPIMYEYFKKALAPYSVVLLKGQTELSRNYPSNIAYNIATVGSKAFIYSRYADKKVVKELKKRAVYLIDVKQGYTKCSTAVIDDSGIITSDLGIYAGALKNGIDSLLIEPGHIKLEGFDYGFIGGCCGNIGKSLLVFAGDPSFHPDWVAISNFLKKRGVTAVSLFEGPLMDVGTVIPVMEIC